MKDNPVGRAVPPKLNANERLSEYFKSKRLFIEFPGRPTFKVPPTLEHQLAKTRRVLRAADQQLLKKRSEAEAASKKIILQYEKVKELERKLKDDYFHKYNEFVIGNQLKRERAQRILKESRNLYEKYCRDIDTLFDKLRRLQYIKRQYEQNIQNYKIYENYLDATCQMGDFKSPAAVMLCFSTLQETKQEIMVNEVRREEEMEEVFEKFAVNLHRRKRSLEDYNFRSSMLQKRYDTARRRTLIWEGVLNKIGVASMNIVMDTSKIKERIDGLYNYMAARNSHKMYKAPGSALTHERKLFLIDYYLRLMPIIQNKIKKLRQ